MTAKYGIYFSFFWQNKEDDIHPLLLSGGVGTPVP